MSKKFGKMKPEIKEKFIKALTSGKYVKADGELQGKKYFWDGKGRAKRSQCYCAAGVLMDLYAKEKRKGWDTIFPDWANNSHIIPNKVLAWAGLPEVEQIHFTRTSDIMYVNDKYYKGVEGYEKVVEYVEKYL